MTSRRVLIVGCGNIGFRHLEATVGAGVSDVWIVEKELSRLKQRIADTKLGQQASLDLFSSLDAVRDPEAEFDCVISGLTTTAQVELFPKLMSLPAKCFLLEKPIAQSLESLADLWRQIQAGPGADAVLVNCSRDTWNGYVRIREALETLRRGGAATFHVEVFGNLWGLGCNSVHYLELFRMFTGATRIEPVWQQVTNSPLGNKRGPEFEEFVGTMAFRNEHGDTLVLTSAFNGTTARNPAMVVEELETGHLFFADEERDLWVDLRDGRRGQLESVRVSLSTGSFLRRLFGATVRGADLGLPRFREVMIGQEALLAGLRNATGRERAAIT